MVGQVFGAFLVALASGFISATPEIIGAVANLVSALLTAFTELLPKIGETANALIATLVGVLVESIPLIADAGYKLILGLLTAVQENIDDIVVAGVGIVVSFINGMAEAIPDYVEAVVGLITSFIDSISDNLDDILDSGVDLIVEFIEGLGENSQDIIDAGVDTVLDFIEGVGDNAVELANGAGQVILDLLIGLREAVDTYLPQIRNEGLKLIGAIIDGMTGGIAGKLGGLVKSLGGGLISGVKGFLGIFSPSREFMKIGEFVMLGLAAGVANDRPVISQIEKTSNSMLDKVSDTLAKIPDMVNNSSSFNPTITPVLDLTKFTTDAKAISNLLPTARVSAVQASGISQLLTAERELESVGAANVGPAVQFNQTINSPTALSAADIYRQTRNQINFAKEELNIP
jgi:phage-related protein